MSITLVSKQGEKFSVPQKIGVMSELIQGVIENDPDSLEEIPINVSTDHLKIFIAYCEHYNFSKKQTTIIHPLISNQPEEFIKDEWERAFITKYDQNMVIDLLEAANYLNCPALFELCCAVIAADFKGKDFEELKKEYGLYDVEYTPEDEEEIMKEYPWILEESEARIQKLKADNGGLP